MPGLIVEARVSLVMRLGVTAVIRAEILAAKWLSDIDNLPKTTCMRGALASPATRILPASSSFLFLSGSVVTVPVLGLGIKPLGPKILANLAILGIMAGELMRISKSILPAST